MALDVNNPNAVKGFSREAEVQVMQGSFLMRNDLLRFVSSTDKSMAPEGFLLKQDALGKRATGPGAGYQETFPMIGAAQGYVTTGNAPVDGTEVSPQYFSDTHGLNFQRKPFITQGMLSEQISLRPQRDDVLTQMKEYWPIHYDNRMIVGLSGAVGNGSWDYFDATATTDGTRDVYGSFTADGNALRTAAMATGRYVYPAAITAASSLTTAHVFTLDFIDKALLQALTPDKNSTYKRLCRPVIRKGTPMAVAVIDFICVADLIAATGSRWFIIEQAKAQGGDKDSAFYGMNDLIGIYNSPFGTKVALFAHPRMVRFSATVTNGPDGTAYAVKAVRNLLLFRDAGRITIGKDFKEQAMYDWYEELMDAGAKLRVTASTTYGFQATAFNLTETGTTRQLYGVVWMDCYGNW